MVIAAAKLRHALAANGVAKRLADIALSKRTKDADVIAATQDLFDRAGVRRVPDARTPLSRKELQALRAARGVGEPDQWVWRHPRKALR